MEGMAIRVAGHGETVFAVADLKSSRKCLESLPTLVAQSKSGQGEEPSKISAPDAYGRVIRSDDMKVIGGSAIRGIVGSRKQRIGKAFGL